MIDYPLETILLPQGAKEVKDEKKMEALWDDSNYVAEEKYDGSRYLSVGGRMFSRRVSDVTGYPVEKTGNIPHIVELLNKFPNLILDGEVYYEGMTSNEVTSIMGASADKARWRQGFGEFEAPFLVGSKGRWRMDKTQDWVEVPKKEVVELVADGVKAPLKYVMFDILRDLDGNWLIDLPWKERRIALIRTFVKMEIELKTEDNPLPFFEIIELSRTASENKRDFYNEIMHRGGEGVILKNVTAKYCPDAKPMWNWVKVKKHITVDVVIMGFKPAKKEYSGEDYDTHPYWEDATGLFTASGVDEATSISHARGSTVQPVSKFYYYGWIGAVTFGQFDPTNVVEMCDRDGKNCMLYPQLKELGYFSGIKEDLRQDMTENPLKYIGECVEVGAMEKTKDGFYRHPQFSRMRPDKNPSECTIGG